LPRCALGHLKPTFGNLTFGTESLERLRMRIEPISATDSTYGLFLPANGVEVMPC
jgi:hypothetical protein